MQAVDAALDAIAPLLQLDATRGESSQASRSVEAVLSAFEAALESEFSSLELQTSKDECAAGDSAPTTTVEPSLDQISVRRVFITPTRVVCLPAELEAANRAFRIFQAASGLASRAAAEAHFLRVTFTDENFSPVLYRGGPGRFDGVEQIYDRMRLALYGGVEVAGRAFHFLGWSSSMIKEHACWFFAPLGACEKGLPSASAKVASAASATASASVSAPTSAAVITADQLRGMLGDFTQIPVVAKCAARIAQCFSATVATSVVEPGWMKNVPDVSSACGRYTFSDGVSTVSEELAGEIYATYRKLTRHQSSSRRMTYQQIISLPTAALSELVVTSAPSAPSAFQYRCGGVKGVTSVDVRLPGKMLNIRPSMRKFEGQTTTFDLCTTARSLPAFLNRQIITLLTTSGVPDSVFETMQSGILHRLSAGLNNPVTARTIFSSCDGGALSAADLIDIASSPFDLTEEPFLAGIAAAAVKSQLKDLQQRTRILVEKGAVLLGILDEAALLEYGEVYVAFSDTENGFVPGCEVLVTRCPCCHPGDIRVLRAQTLEVLISRAGGRGTARGAEADKYFRRLSDVVIFPQKGPRPHPDEMAGGDLDGDQYFVFWDPLLLPPRERWNVPAMNYQAPPPKIADELPVSIDSIAGFFIDFIRNDNLGIISNAHVAFADLSPQGAACKECLELAALASTAVDFQKTGIPAVIPRELMVKKYPDFMENDIHESYPSQKVIGRMFREVKGYISDMDAHQQHQQQKASSSASTTRALTADPDLHIQGLGTFYDIALRHSEDWRLDLQALMAKFGVRTESELMSGHVDKFRARAFRKKKKYEVQELLRREVRKLRLIYRGLFAGTVRSYVDALLLETATTAETSSAEAPQSTASGASANGNVTAETDTRKIGGVSTIIASESPPLRIRAGVAWLRYSGSDLLPGEMEAADDTYLAQYVTAAAQLASAWYEVTYNPVPAHAHTQTADSSRQILSLPWLVWELLVHIKSCKRPV